MSAGTLGGTPPTGGSAGRGGFSGSTMIAFLPIPSSALASSSASTAAFPPPRSMVREFGLNVGPPDMPSAIGSPSFLRMSFASMMCACVPLMSSPGRSPVFCGSMLGPPASELGISRVSVAAASPGSRTVSAMNAFSAVATPVPSPLMILATAIWSSGEPKTMIWCWAWSGTTVNHGNFAWTAFATSVAEPVGTVNVFSTGSAGMNFP